jgi:hypothetical protein
MEVAFSVSFVSSVFCLETLRWRHGDTDMETWNKKKKKIYIFIYIYIYIYIYINVRNSPLFYIIPCLHVHILYIYWAYSGEDPYVFISQFFFSVIFPLLFFERLNIYTYVAGLPKNQMENRKRKPRRFP